jgi:tetratricopeptide (TPR) repeat protein
MPTRRDRSSKARKSLRSGERVRTVHPGEPAVRAIAVFPPIAAADPDDADPDLAKRDADYAAGRRAAENKNWVDAVRAYERAEKRNPDQADLQNNLGYAYRNLKQYDLAFRHYKRAIEIDPRHRGAHEYIGEAYLMTDDLASAEKHLAALREICLLPCEELNDLERAVAEYRSRKL